MSKIFVSPIGVWTYDFERLVRWKFSPSGTRIEEPFNIVEEEVFSIFGGDLANHIQDAYQNYLVDEIIR